MALDVSYINWTSCEGESAVLWNPLDRLRNVPLADQDSKTLATPLDPGPPLVSAIGPAIEVSGLEFDDAGAGGVDWNELITSPPLPASTIAQKLGQPLSKVERVLRHQRKVRPFCCIEDDAPQKGNAKYLHKMPEVIPALKKWLEKQGKKK